MNIAICDDEILFTRELSSLLTHWAEKNDFRAAGVPAARPLCILFSRVFFSLRGRASRRAGIFFGWRRRRAGAVPPCSARERAAPFHTAAGRSAEDVRTDPCALCFWRCRNAWPPRGRWHCSQRSTSPAHTPARLCSFASCTTPLPAFHLYVRKVRPMKIPQAEEKSAWGNKNGFV